ncbi:MAG: hypothetical protein HYR63_07690 [Proteobacteria bacterium]|nr:hypothetical protein [Pseudomonadota bacterium]
MLSTEFRLNVAELNEGGRNLSQELVIPLGRTSLPQWPLKTADDVICDTYHPHDTRRCSFVHSTLPNVLLQRAGESLIAKERNKNKKNQSSAGFALLLAETPGYLNYDAAGPRLANSHAVIDAPMEGPSAVAGPQEAAA